MFFEKKIWKGSCKNLFNGEKPPGNTIFVRFNSLMNGRTAVKAPPYPSGDRWFESFWVMFPLVLHSFSTYLHVNVEHPSSCSSRKCISLCFAYVKIKGGTHCSVCASRPVTPGSNPGSAKIVSTA